MRERIFTVSKYFRQDTYFYKRQRSNLIVEEPSRHHLHQVIITRNTDTTHHVPLEMLHLGRPASVGLLRDPAAPAYGNTDKPKCGGQSAKQTGLHALVNVKVLKDKDWGTIPNLRRMKNSYMQFTTLDWILDQKKIFLLFLLKWTLAQLVKFN